MIKPKKIYYGIIDLPLAQLHYLRCGKGPNLIMYPATISEIKNWLPAVEILAERFTVFFFELPGHRKSIIRNGHYSAGMVASTVRHFADALGIKQFSILGFSYGGILVLESLPVLSDRLDKVILIAPVVSNRALKLSIGRKLIIGSLSRIMSVNTVQNLMLSIMHSRTSVGVILWIVKHLGHVDVRPGLKQKLLFMPKSRLRVLITQVREVLSYKPTPPADQYNLTCFTGMVKNDQLLDGFEVKNVLSKYFRKLRIEIFDLPSHQPDKKIVIRKLEERKNELLDMITG